nr:hypothetical protein 24 [bacterium]
MPPHMLPLMFVEMQRQFWMAWLQQFDASRIRYWVWENVCYPEAFGWRTV